MRSEQYQRHKPDFALMTQKRDGGGASQSGALAREGRRAKSADDPGAALSPSRMFRNHCEFGVDFFCLERSGR